MKKYIKITNFANSDQSGFVNRLNLEKLGLSTKRNDPDTIGQFGSGIKYAPIAALRMGLKWVFVGNDEQGPYTLSYIVKEESGINCIYYQYNDSEPKSSSFTLEAGMLSWEDEFQIYREAISNAKDGGIWDRSIVTKIGKPVEGEFSVYITASPKMMDIYNNHEIYFCDNQTVLFKYGHTSILKSIVNSGNPLRVYCKSVLVHENKEVKNHLFNYQSNDIVLNEDRQVKDNYSLQSNVAFVISKISDDEMVDNIFESVLVKREKPWEFYGLYDGAYSYMTPSDNWSKIFRQKFTSKAVLLSPEESLIPNIDSVLSNKDKVAVRCHSDLLFRLLRNTNITLAKDIVSEEFNYDLNYDFTKFPKLQKAIEICTAYEPSFSLMDKPIAVFKSKTTDALGQTLNINKSKSERQIIIDQSHVENSNVYELVATLIHEYDHYSTGITDSTYREFRNLADSRIGRLVCDLYQQTLVTVNDQGFWISINNLSQLTSLQYSLKQIRPGKYLLQIGDSDFIITEPSNSMPNELSGQLVPSSDGKTMGIPFDLNTGKNDVIKQTNKEKK